MIMGHQFSDLFKLTSTRIVCLGILTICAGGLVILINRPAPASQSRHRQAFVTSAGIPIATFFAGIPTSQKFAEMAHRPRIPRSSCEKPSGISRLMKMFNLNTTVYAQAGNLCTDSGTCSPCGYVIDPIDCTTCGYGTYDNFFESTGVTGIKPTATPNCGRSDQVCDCLLDFCDDNQCQH